jgi:hypothetical protein
VLKKYTKLAVIYGFIFTAIGCDLDNGYKSEDISANFIGNIAT